MGERTQTNKPAGGKRRQSFPQRAFAAPRGALAPAFAPGHSRGMAERAFAPPCPEAGLGFSTPDGVAPAGEPVHLSPGPDFDFGAISLFPAAPGALRAQPEEEPEGQGEQPQAKLTVGTPGDKHEQEADRVADAVMNMPQPQSAGRVTGEAAPGGPRRQPVPEEEEAAPKLLQRQEAPEEEEAAPKEQPGGTPRVTPGVEKSIASMRGGGQPMAPASRDFFEPRFGRDFSRVRLHTGPRAADASTAIQARAFTLGRDVFFGQGQYQPGTSGGKKLMAHELAHVGQQGEGKLRKKEKKGEKAKNKLIASGEQSYTVKEGETPRSIAKMFNVSQEFLEKRNELHTFNTTTGDKVKGFLIDQKIIIPRAGKKTGAQKKEEKEKGKICGPDITSWLKKQMLINGESKIIQEMKESNKKAWFGDHSVWAQNEFYDLVAGGKPWDFKTLLGEKINHLKPCRQNCNGILYSVTLDGQCMTYEVAANIHYAYVGRLSGFTEKKLLNKAADAQKGENGDDPRDVQAIKKGFELFKSGGPNSLDKSGLENNFYQNLSPGEGDPIGCEPCEKKL